MAYDKVIDSSVLDGNLTSIANAIREKAGLEENFAFPQGFIDAIAGIEAGGGTTLWNGGKYTIGSFVLAEETTTEYTIATSNHAAMLDLLNDGESVARVYQSIGLLVMAKPSLDFSASSTYRAKKLYNTIRQPLYFGSGSQATTTTTYADSYGSATAKNSASMGAVVDSTKLAVKFAESQVGIAGHEYLWLAWRGVQ